MRINKFVALASALSRRSADRAIADGRVQLNGASIKLGQEVGTNDFVTLDGTTLNAPETSTTIILNKPVGYVVSRDGQGSPTIYDLLPPEFHNLKPIGRLDKDSSGLLLLTNNGELANQLTHPKFAKEKVYEIELDKSLTPTDKTKIENGVELEDGSSKLQLSGEGETWVVTMAEGRNRQIRRTFRVLGYRIVKLHRTQFGQYSLKELSSGKFLVK